MYGGKFAYIFQRLFLRSLYSEGLMFGGKFPFQNRLGWLVVGRKFTIFVLFYFVFEGKFQVQAPPEGLYSEGRFNGGSSALRFWGLIIGGAYFWNFTVPSEFMTKSIKLNLYGEFNLTIIDPCKLLREIENKPGQFLLCFTSRM